MKYILVFGKNSYIGSSFKQYHSQNNSVKISEMESKGDEWKTNSFKNYDTIFYVAGIAHVSSDPKLEKLYYYVNRDLAVEIAKKAKSEGVKQFVYLSSMIVYGDDLPIGKSFIIDKDTMPAPANFYGQSKLDAENLLTELKAVDFTISILRLPMIYGPECKGNFPKLLTLAKRSFVFPSIINHRSMLYIDNLSEFVLKIIKNRVAGILHPQNTEYVETKDIIRIAAKHYKNKIAFVGIFNTLLKRLSRKIGFLKKIFGTRVYDKSITTYPFDYNTIDFEESIKRCVFMEVKP